MMKYLQRIGKSLMLPVALLPAAALLMGIGYWIDPSGWGANSPIASLLITAGGALVSKLPLLFAIGVSLGMTKKQDGAAALAGIAAFLIITNVLKTESVANLLVIPVEEVPVAFGKIDNSFIGILAGVIGAFSFDKFHKVELPKALAFFSGKRLAPIMSSVIGLIVSGILFFIWPAIFSGLVTFGTSITGLGALGAGIFGFFNRLLIPIGLHHALNAVFFFDVAGISDIGNFWGGIGIKGVTGMYQAGFFPVMMFGLPAAGFAMYQAAKPEKKQQIASLMLTAGFASFITGVTEPLEFAFMFAAPLLYVVHAFLTGLSMTVASLMHATAGFTFSGGLIDFILSSRLPMANKPFLLIIQGLVFGVIYYLIFRFLINKFNLLTPGREEDDYFAEEEKLAFNESNYKEVAEKVLKGIGGLDNLTGVDNCTTRLRLEVKDSSLVNDKLIKESGAFGVIKPSKNSVQVVIGPDVEFVAEELKKIFFKD